MSASDHLSSAQFTSQTWYHAGEPPTGDRQVHLGTRRAAVQRVDPRNWDPPDEFPEIGAAKLFRVRLHPETKVHPEVGKDYAPAGTPDWDQQSVGSLGYRLPADYHAKVYVNDNEDPGSLSAVVHGSRIAHVEEALDPHRGLRRKFQNHALRNLREDDPEQHDFWRREYGR
jgi:hypothetical protein